MVSPVLLDHLIVQVNPVWCIALAARRPQGDQAAANSLALHFNLLESLWHRFARLAHEAALDGTGRSSMRG